MSSDEDRQQTLTSLQWTGGVLNVHFGKNKEQWLTQQRLRGRWLPRRKRNNGKLTACNPPRCFTSSERGEEEYVEHIAHAKDVVREDTGWSFQGSCFLYTYISPHVFCVRKLEILILFCEVPIRVLRCRCRSSMSAIGRYPYRPIVWIRRNIFNLRATAPPFFFRNRWIVWFLFFIQLMNPI